MSKNSSYQSPVVVQNATISNNGNNMFSQIHRPIIHFQLPSRIFITAFFHVHPPFKFILAVFFFI